MGLKQQLTTVSAEVVDAVPCLSKKEVTKIERRALSLYGEAQRTSVLLAVELRRLQNGGAYLVRGYPNFGEYIEHALDINKNTAQQLSREGNVLILLEKAGKIKTEGKGENLPGTTGVRSLSVILKKFGEDVMFAVYDAALASERKITAETVLAATKQLEVAQPVELDSGEAPSIPVETDDEDMPVEPYEPEHEHVGLIERLADLQDSIYAISDCIAEGSPVEAIRELHQVTKALEDVKVELVKITFDATEIAG